MCSYLSNDQSPVLGGCHGLVALRVLNQHGLGRLRLSVTHPPVEAMGISNVRNQTGVKSHAEKPCNILLDLTMQIIWAQNAIMISVYSCHTSVRLELKHKQNEQRHFIFGL